MEAKQIPRQDPLIQCFVSGTAELTCSSPRLRKLNVQDPKAGFEPPFATALVGICF